MNDVPGMAKLLYGERAVHVPCWMYVQGPGQLVTFAGASKVPEGDNPLCFGTQWAHQFVVGEIIVRPHLVVGTDALRGEGLAGLLAGEHDIRAMLRNGEKVTGTDAALRRVLGRQHI